MQKLKKDPLNQLLKKEVNEYKEEKNKEKIEVELTFNDNDSSSKDNTINIRVFSYEEFKEMDKSMFKMDVYENLYVHY